MFLRSVFLFIWRYFFFILFIFKSIIECLNCIFVCSCMFCSKKFHIPFLSYNPSERRLLTLSSIVRSNHIIAECKFYSLKWNIFFGIKIWCELMNRITFYHLQTHIHLISVWFFMFFEQKTKRIVGRLNHSVVLGGLNKTMNKLS